jgi:hypothetical protein
MCFMPESHSLPPCGVKLKLEVVYRLNKILQSSSLALNGGQD